MKFLRTSMEFFGKSWNCLAIPFVFLEKRNAHWLEIQLAGGLAGPHLCNAQMEFFGKSIEFLRKSMEFRRGFPAGWRSSWLEIWLAQICLFSYLVFLVLLKKSPT